MLWGYFPPSHWHPTETTQSDPGSRLTLKLAPAFPSHTSLAIPLMQAIASPKQPQSPQAPAQLFNAAGKEGGPRSVSPASPRSRPASNPHHGSRLSAEQRGAPVACPTPATLVPVQESDATRRRDRSALARLCQPQSALSPWTSRPSSHALLSTQADPRNHSPPPEGKVRGTSTQTLTASRLGAPLSH